MGKFRQESSDKQLLKGLEKQRYGGKEKNAFRCWKRGNWKEG